MNKGGSFEAAGDRADHAARRPHRRHHVTGGEAEATREVGCWGWLIEFEDGSRVYHSGDTDLFGDMALVRERWHRPSRSCRSAGTTRWDRPMRPRAEADRRAEVLPVHWATFPVLAGRPDDLASQTDATCCAWSPGRPGKPDRRAISAAGTTGRADAA